MHHFREISMKITEQCSSIKCLGEITRDANDIHVREIILKEIENVLDTLGNHIHPHCIPSTAGKPGVQILPRNCTFNPL